MLVRKCLVKWYPLSPEGERVWGMRLTIPHLPNLLSSKRGGVHHDIFFKE
jgi:hypothetical protein